MIENPAVTKTLVYAGIGTREPTVEQAVLIKKAGRYLAKKGYRLTTGAADGTDRLFAEAAWSVGGEVELHIPWSAYTATWIEECKKKFPGLVHVFVLKKADKEAYQSVKDLHPAPDQLKWSVKSLHARNYRIVNPLETGPVDFVVANPHPGGGGTSQGIRVARKLGVPVVRLDAMDEEELRVRLIKMVTSHGQADV